MKNPISHRYALAQDWLRQWDWNGLDRKICARAGARVSRSILNELRPVPFSASTIYFTAGDDKFSFMLDLKQVYLSDISIYECGEHRERRVDQIAEALHKLADDIVKAGSRLSATDRREITAFNERWNNAPDTIEGDEQ